LIDHEYRQERFDYFRLENIETAIYFRIIRIDILINSQECVVIFKFN